MAKPLKQISADSEMAIAFITALFGEGRTESKVYFCSLANDKPPPAGQKSEYRLTTRDAALLQNFIETYDVPERGMFFCVGTVVDRRLKDKIVETIGLWADIDYKGVEAGAEEVEAAIAKLGCKPTVIIYSGHGVHLYWLFEKSIAAQSNREHVEELLKLVCDHVAGDPQVCEISRLMRLPGTHNTKFASWVPVKVGYLDGPRHTLEELEQWLGTRSTPLQKPLLRRRVGSEGSGLSSIRPGASPSSSETSSNPFLRAAKDLGFQTPIDVNARLAAMSYQGAGDGGVHATQLQVTAALLERGMSVDDVVTIVFEATQALPNTGNWNWKEERRNLHSMCLTWLHKRSRQDPVETPAAAQAEPDEKVVSFSKHKRSEAVAPRQKAKKKDQHVVVGQGVLEAIIDRGERILVTADGVYWYADNVWTLQDEKDLRRRLNAEIEIGARVLELRATTRLINEAREWIMREPKIYQRDIKFDAHGKVPVFNGLIDPRSGVLEPPIAEHYITWRIEYIYNPEAKCELWLRMLFEILADRDPEERQQYVDLIQELLGVGLINNRGKALSRALVFQGPQNSGKSGMLEVLGGLYGADVNMVPLSSLDGNHGTMPFLHRRPWILHEAFDEGVWMMSSTVKSIISGDPIAINIKNGAIISRRFQAPIFWATNHPPAFKETTRAIIERLVVVPCREIFSQDNPVGLALIAKKKGYSGPAQMVLETEMEGVLAWAIEGLRRALKRGHLILPADSIIAAEELQRESNVALGFFDHCVEFSPAYMVSTADINAAFRSWYQEEHDTDRPPMTRFCRSIPMLPNAKCIALGRDLRTNSKRYYGCIKLSEGGLRHWRNAVTADNFALKGKTANTTDADGNPTVVMPASWSDNQSVLRARMAQGVGYDRLSKSLVNRDPTENFQSDQTMQSDPKVTNQKTGPVTSKGSDKSGRTRF